MKQLLVTFLLLLLTSAVSAQKTKTVEAEYTYHVPENVTLELAKQTALDRAKTQAIADEFGTIMSQSNVTRVENRNGHSSVGMLSIGGSDVKGEWIETVGEPIYNIRYEGEMLVVTCQVKGKAREIVTAQIDFKALILRNGTDERYESDQFKNGDDLYLLFQSPVSGYLTVYLVDADNQAYCLLPYRNQTDGIYPIKANQRYLFFNEKAAPANERALVDEYTMTCSRSSEHNQIYIIFSPNQFAKAADNRTDNSLPRQLDFENFNKWLVKCRRHDKDMNLRMVPITIKKK